MATANFVSGKPVMADYTPGSAVAAGDVVVLENTVGIAHKDIAASELGALAVGGGVYDMVYLANVAVGTKMYYDGTSKVSSTSTNNTAFGFALESTGAANTVGQVLHWPF